jgi:hypothetical protein
MMAFSGRIFSVIALLALALQGCDNGALPPEAGYASVSGAIVDAKTNAPVSGAVITIDTVLTATTDAAGHFSIDRVPSGIADYVVQASGYQPLSSTATLEPGKPFALNLTLTNSTTPPPQNGDTHSPV